MTEPLTALILVALVCYGLGYVIGYDAATKWNTEYDRKKTKERQNVR